MSEGDPKAVWKDLEAKAPELHPPQRLAELRARYGEAVGPVYELNSRGVLPIGEVKAHTFDFLDGLRLTVTRNRVRTLPCSEPFVMVSASTAPNSPFDQSMWAFPDLKWFCQRLAPRWRKLAGSDDRLYLMTILPNGFVPLFVAADPCRLPFFIRPTCVNF